MTPRRADGFLPVFDASTWAAIGQVWNQDISNGAKLIQEYNELVKIWTSGMQIYNLGTAMAQSFTSGNKSAWVTLAQMATNDVTQIPIRRDDYLAHDGQRPSLSRSASLGHCYLSGDA